MNARKKEDTLDGGQHEHFMSGDNVRANWRGTYSVKNGFLELFPDTE